LSSAGCGAEFDSISQVKQLRVLGVKKSSPYARPGDSVELEMMYHDGGSERARELEVMWLSGCENPPADLYELCLELLGPALSNPDAAGPPPETDPDAPRPPPETDPDEDASLNALFRGGVEAKLGRVSLGPGVALGFKRSFTLEVAEDIISKRPPPSDPRLTRYGLNYVFFAVCAGELHLDLDSGSFPVECLDKDGNRLGTEDFVVGYSAVYAYDKLTNNNPRISGFEVGGDRLPRDQYCVGSDCEVTEPDPKRKCEKADPRVQACADEDSDDCPKLSIRPLIDPRSVELDGVLTVSQGADVDEQMWLNYHSDRGKFTFDLSLVNDAQSGFKRDIETEFVAPEAKGPTQVWTVVRDNRGGAEWARFQICVE
jgi:hypothetical protein